MIVETKSMALRDWFAGQALAGLCAGDIMVALNKTSNGKPREAVATVAYGLADAMLIERERSNG